ncbi:MAG TPA: response regulator transcription factor [Candidatus Limnocylindrales bacterium]|nr:response regulator transcription factor [Candidatus Limnocylindrales bacterium]
MNDGLRIVVADDHPLYRDGVVRTLREAGFDVVAEASTGRDAVAAVSRFAPDLALFDVAMPGGGVAAARAASEASPTTRVVMLTVSEAHDDLVAAIEAGAAGYVLKGVAGRELVAILRQVAGGDRYISSRLAFEALGRRPATETEPDPLAELTVREREILDLVAEGLSNAEIGDRLALAEKTVKHYMTLVLGKLDARSRVEAALIAYKAGLGRGRQS